MLSQMYLAVDMLGNCSSALSSQKQTAPQLRSLTFNIRIPVCFLIFLIANLKLTARGLAEGAADVYSSVGCEDFSRIVYPLVSLVADAGVVTE